mmetsp:Transcript_21426/g.46542  ORF Transcript_21426/g.46542 Transcript_21426/m.46542 type:complete len:182 (-) Transcript_21426:1004-1549(-)
MVRICSAFRLISAASILKRQIQWLFGVSSFSSFQHALHMLTVVEQFFMAQLYNWHPRIFKYYGCYEGIPSRFLEESFTVKHQYCNFHKDLPPFLNNPAWLATLFDQYNGQVQGMSLCLYNILGEQCQTDANDGDEDLHSHQLENDKHLGFAFVGIYLSHYTDVPYPNYHQQSSTASPRQWK